MYDLIIVGGGTGGISVASRIIKLRPNWKIAIIEPSKNHYYQPLWTLVGGGVYPREVTQKKEAPLIPAGIGWIQESVTNINPNEKSVQTNQTKYSFKYLVVAVGISMYWKGVKGLKESLGKPMVGCNYTYDTCEDTWKAIQQFEGGDAYFTYPKGAIKCGGAPQKIMWLAEHYWRRKGIRDKTNIYFVSPADHIFGVEKYKKALEKLVDQRSISTLFQQEVVEINSDEKTIIIKKEADQSLTQKKYDFIHITPPQRPPKFIQESALADEAGFVKVNKQTLQHTDFPFIFSLGDCSSLPTSKTGAAIRKQAPILVNNLVSYDEKSPLKAIYNGYTSCPIVTGYGRLILAEFDYDGKPVETFPFDQSKERLSMYLLKKHVLPPLYWHGMLKGRA